MYLCIFTMSTWMKIPLYIGECWTRCRMGVRKHGVNHILDSAYQKCIFRVSETPMVSSKALRRIVDLKYNSFRSIHLTQIIWYIWFLFLCFFCSTQSSINFWIHSVIIKLLPCLVLTVISFILINVLYQAAKRKVKLKGYNQSGGMSAANANVALNGHRYEFIFIEILPPINGAMSAAGRKNLITWNRLVTLNFNFNSARFSLLSADHRNVHVAPIAQQCCSSQFYYYFSLLNSLKGYLAYWVEFSKNASSSNATIKWAKWWICWHWLMRL